MKYKVNRIRIMPSNMNSHCRFYAISRKIASSGETFYQPPTAKDIRTKYTHHNYTYKFAPAVEGLLNELFMLEGVISVAIGTHDVSVTIAAAYDFADVQDEILTILRRTFFEGDHYAKVELRDDTQK